MTNPNIRIKRSAVPGKRPSNSQMELGELALNTNDGRLFTKKENVGIGTTVTLLNVWTENVGGGVYYNDGSVGIGTSIPTSLLELYTSDGNIKLGDITAQPTTDVGISFSGLGTYTSAIFTELDGQILSYGINTPQIQNPRNTGRVGGIFRLDSRPPGGLGDSSCFVIKYAPVGFATTAGGPENGIKNGLILSLQDGKTYLVPDEGNVLVGLKTDTGTLNQKLQVLGGAYVSGNIGVGTTNPIGLFQVGSASTQSVAINEFGRIGIGTTNPITRLDLIGVARVGGNDNLDVYTLTYADPSAVDVISIESINRENTIKKNLALNAYGGNVLIGSASLTGTNSQPFQVTGGAYVSGNIGVGTTNPTSKLQVDGNATINGNLNVAIGGTFPIISTLIGEASGYNGSGIAVTQTRYGIGIGTTNPFIPFYSDSDTQITNTFTFYNTEWIAANSYNNSVTRIGADSGRSIEIGMGNTDLPKYIDFGGGNFPGLLYPDWQARILRNGTDDGSLQILSRGSGTVSISAGQTSGETGNFDIFTANTRRLRVSSTGNIGLNVLNPTSRLHVSGDSLITGVVTATTFVGALSGTATSTVNIPNLTGDVTSNNTVTTLATVNSNVGTFGGTGAIPVVTVNGKGLVTGVTTVTPNNGTLTLSVSGTGLSGSSTFTANQAGNSTFTVTSNATSDNTNSTIVSRNGSGGFVAGIITATQFSTGSGNVAIGTNIITGPAEITIDPAAVGDNTGAVRIKGDLYVDGTQTIINSSTIELADFNVGIATTVGTNLLLDGAGIGIGSSAIRKTITWNNSASALTSSEDWNLVSGKQYEINGTSVLSSTTLGSGVVNSSLTSVGTLNNLNVSGVSTSLGGFIGNLTGNLNSSGVNTATTISGTTLTYTNGSITNVSGTNLNYTGISTVTNVRSTTLNNTGVGTITTLNSTTGTITNLSGTNVSYSGIGTVGSLNIGSTQVISSGRQLQNIASLDATTTATIETAIANAPNTFTDLQVTGLSTFTNGPVLIGSGTPTGTTNQRLQVIGNAYFSESIGIGTTRPSGNLHIQSNSPTVFYVDANSTPDNKVWANVANDKFLYWQAIADSGAGGGSGFRFEREASEINYFDGTRSGLPWFRIDNLTARVGIGTSVPLDTLHVLSSTGKARFQNSTNNISVAIDPAVLGPRIAFGADSNNSLMEFGAYNNTNNIDTKFRDFRILSTSVPNAFTLRHSTGFVGIGITNPSAILSVGNGSLGDANLPVQISTQSVNGQIYYGANNNGSYGALFGYDRAGFNGGVVRVVGATDTLDLVVNNTTRAITIIPSGNTGIGTTNPTSKLHVVGDVLVSGAITSTDYNSASDINLKENIKPISNPIDKVMNITGVSFNWKAGGKSSMGVIAQEIEKVMPEIVSGGDSKTVNYNGLIGLLIEVVKEQQKEINMLKENMKRL